MWKKTYVIMFPFINYKTFVSIEWNFAAKWDCIIDADIWISRNKREWTHYAIFKINGPYYTTRRTVRKVLKLPVSLCLNCQYQCWYLVENVLLKSYICGFKILTHSKPIIHVYIDMRLVFYRKLFKYWLFKHYFLFLTF